VAGLRLAAGLRRVWTRADVVAGLTVWAVLVPEALAYAPIAGVPPVVGLYPAIPSLVPYAVAGSSRHLLAGCRWGEQRLVGVAVALGAFGLLALQRQVGVGGESNGGFGSAGLHRTDGATQPTAGHFRCRTPWSRASRY
jgi:hypothetical protein